MEKFCKNRNLFPNGVKKTKHLSFYASMLLFFFSILNLNCREGYPGIAANTTASIYSFIQPEYNDIKLMPAGDSLYFPLSETTYNEIKSFNYFEDDNLPFISFYDQRSQSICIYDFSSQQRVEKIRLKKYLLDQAFYKTSVYVKNFDSIYITNQGTLYLIDSSGNIKTDIDFSRSGKPRAYFENSSPVVFKNNTMYMCVRPSLDERSTSDVREWRVLYEFGIEMKKKKLYYSLPKVYLDNLYNDHFFSYSYCINDRGNFVFSFPADTNIYETDLIGLHRSYYGKSRLQREHIQSVSEESFEKDEGFKEYSLRDTYDAIYYDSFRKRYLRVARQKISESDYEKGLRKKQSLIIFNNDFQIIGESEISGDFLPGSIFFTGDGKIYARTKVNDENALHFVRLTYWDENQNEQSKLASNHLTQ